MFITMGLHDDRQSADHGRLGRVQDRRRRLRMDARHRHRRGDPAWWSSPCSWHFVMPKFKAMQQLTDNINLVARENLTGLRVVRAYNAEDYQEAKFTEANKESHRTPSCSPTAPWRS
jgi:ABC-type multidrug transport system fused ATPase/permease subunit